MARTIGVKNINMVKRLTISVINRRRAPWGEIRSYSGVEDEVINLLPSSLWETWEMADQQIRRIIDDEIMGVSSKYEKY